MRGDPLQPRVPHGLVATRGRKSSALGAALGASALDVTSLDWEQESPLGTKIYSEATVEKDPVKVSEKTSVHFCQFAMIAIDDQICHRLIAEQHGVAESD